MRWKEGVQAAREGRRRESGRRAEGREEVWKGGKEGLTDRVTHVLVCT